MNKLYFSSKALIVSDNKILMLKGVYEGEKFWDLPGGSLEYGETAEMALIREVKEEIGVNATPIKLIDTWNYMHRDYQIVGVVYLCEIDSTEFVISDEHDSYEWIKIDRLDKEINAEYFLERIRNWNWDSVLSTENIMVRRF